MKVYGARAPEVARLASAEPELLEVISEETASVAAEVVFSFNEELAETLADCLLRRTMVGLNGQLVEWTRSKRPRASREGFWAGTKHALGV